MRSSSMSLAHPPLFQHQLHQPGHFVDLNGGNDINCGYIEQREIYKNYDVTGGYEYVGNGKDGHGCVEDFYGAIRNSYFPSSAPSSSSSSSGSFSSTSKFKTTPPGGMGFYKKDDWLKNRKSKHFDVTEYVFVTSEPPSEASESSTSPSAVDERGSSDSPSSSLRNRDQHHGQQQQQQQHQQQPTKRQRLTNEFRRRNAAQAAADRIARPTTTITTSTTTTNFVVPASFDFKAGPAPPVIANRAVDASSRSSTATASSSSTPQASESSALLLARSGKGIYPPQMPPSLRFSSTVLMVVVNEAWSWREAKAGVDEALLFFASGATHTTGEKIFYRYDEHGFSWACSWTGDTTDGGDEAAQKTRTQPLSQAVGTNHVNCEDSGAFTVSLFAHRSRMIPAPATAGPTRQGTQKTVPYRQVVAIQLHHGDESLVTSFYHSLGKVLRKETPPPVPVPEIEEEDEGREHGEERAAAMPRVRAEPMTIYLRDEERQVSLHSAADSSELTLQVVDPESSHEGHAVVRGPRSPVAATKAAALGYRCLLEPLLAALQLGLRAGAIGSHQYEDMAHSKRARESGHIPALLVHVQKTAVLSRRPEEALCLPLAGQAVAINYARLAATTPEAPEDRAYVATVVRRDMISLGFMDVLVAFVSQTFCWTKCANPGCGNGAGGGPDEDQLAVAKGQDVRLGLYALTALANLAQDVTGADLRAVRPSPSRISPFFFPSQTSNHEQHHDRIEKTLSSSSDDGEGEDAKEIKSFLGVLLALATEGLPSALHSAQLRTISAHLMLHLIAADAALLCAALTEAQLRALITYLEQPEVASEYVAVDRPAVHTLIVAAAAALERI